MQNFTAPGYKSRQGRHYWVAREDLVKKGYEPKTVRLHFNFDDPDDRKLAESRCRTLQAEMLEWAGNRGAALAFDGTVKGLITVYQHDPDSPFRKIRHKSRITYGRHMDAIERTVGARLLSALSGRDFLRWYDNWAEDEHGGPRHIPRAHGRMTMLRMLISFGVALELPHCARLSTILAEQRFEVGRRRTVELNAAQAVAIRMEAHRQGEHSIALAQALMSDLIVRQKDAIGEYVPMGEPGLSTIFSHGEKWLFGMTWENTTPDLILTHRLSKSLRGRQAVADPRAGKVKVFDLKLYAMVMEDLQRIPIDQRVGPIVKDEKTGKPWRDAAFRIRWREIARAAGVPDNVQNRDSRAGGITEAIEATDGNVDAARQAAGHAQTSTTLIYARGEDRATAKVAIARAQKRKE